MPTRLAALSRNISDGYRRSGKKSGPDTAGSWCMRLTSGPFGAYRFSKKRKLERPPTPLESESPPELRCRITRPDQCREFIFIQHSDPQSGGLLELGAGIGPGHEIVGFFADAGCGPPAQLFHPLFCF